MYHLQYKKKIANFLACPDEKIFLTGKGRVGLYGILKALGIGAGDEVIIPAFTCVVVPNAIIYCGAKPVYVDIDAQTFNLDPDQLGKKLNSKTKLIIAQNTFGLSSNIDAIKKVANDAGIPVIEDCTHGFGGYYKGVPNGLHADAAFFSTQWNKPFSTGLGGFVYAKDPSLAEALQAFEQSLPSPSKAQQLIMRLQLFIRKYILSPAIYWPLVRLFRFLSKKGIVKGSSAGVESERPVMPDDYLMGLGEVQAREGISALDNFAANLSHRQKLAAMYNQCLVDLGKEPVYIPDYAKHTFVQFPILVKDPDAFTEKAAQHKIPLNNWMCSPIHPVTEHLDRWQYHWGENPVAEEICRHILNLPTDLGISLEKGREIVGFLKAHREWLR